MYISLIAVLLFGSVSFTTGVERNQQPGYTCYPRCVTSTVKPGEKLSFGQHYAVLNLDLITGAVGEIANTSQGAAFIKNVASWIDAVHAQNPPPLSIFTRPYFINSHKPEIRPGIPFYQAGSFLGTEEDPTTQLYPTFKPDYRAGDAVLEKTRYYAGAGNALEEILSTQRIDTVLVSGLTTSGVVLATAYRLFDLNYHVYVIANNTLELPPYGPEVNSAILEEILPKHPINVITIEQALAALENSGPAIY